MSGCAVFISAAVCTRACVSVLMETEDDLCHIRNRYMCSDFFVEKGTFVTIPINTSILYTHANTYI